eukprot:4388887-Alexandrium_andersonii.AAC.1
MQFQVRTPEAIVHSRKADHPEHGSGSLPKGRPRTAGPVERWEAHPVQASDAIPEHGSALDRPLEDELPDRSRAQR